MTSKREDPRVTNADLSTVEHKILPAPWEVIGSYSNLKYDFEKSIGFSYKLQAIFLIKVATVPNFASRILAP